MQPFPELAAAGLELQASIALRDLPNAAVRALWADGVDTQPHSHLVLLGQRGTRLWDASVRHNLDAPDPFDDTVRQLVESWFAEHAPHAALTIVYPGSVMVPLGQLASFVGWGEPSPLGITIHPIHGLWIAHRLAFLCDLDLQFEPEHLPSPCLTCVDSPCVSACPVDAVSVERPFDLRTCAEHRAPEGSSCGRSCAAREACPVSADLRYGPEQMAHHYASGLSSIRSWLAGA
jgi:ferredoxin